MLQGVKYALCFLEPLRSARQLSRSWSQQVHMSKQLNRTESNKDMTQDHAERRTTRRQQTELNTRLTQVTEFH